MDYKFKIKSRKIAQKSKIRSSLRGTYGYIYKTCRKEGLISNLTSDYFNFLDFTRLDYYT